MHSSPRAAISLALALAIMSPLGRVARAQPADASETSFSLHEARLGLATYEPRGGGTIEILRGLTETLRRPRGLAAAREAVFLRAAAATDLLIIAHLAADPELPEALAEVFEIPPGRLMRRLDRELLSVAAGIYAEPVARARGALALLNAGAEPRWHQTTGQGRDALYLDRVLDALGPDRARTLEALARLAPDPCADGTTCADPYRRFDRQGRQAIAALSGAAGAQRRLGSAAERGDPLSLLLAPALETRAAALWSVELRPTPLLPEWMRITEAAGPWDRERAPPDLILAIGELELRYAWVPRVRLDALGSPEVTGPEGAILPDTDAIRLPTAFRPVVRPVARITEALAALGAQMPGGRVAVGATGQVPSHVLARILLSVQGAELGSPLLLGRAPDGAARGIPLNLVRSAEDARNPAEMRVVVRMGGFSVVSRSGAERLPRIQVDEALRFDLAGLEATTGEQTYASAALRFMSAVEAGPVLSAAFRVAPAEAPLTLVLP